jgi:hypothetical protein
MAGSALSEFINRANLVGNFPARVAMNKVLRCEFDKLDCMIGLKEWVNSLFQAGLYESVLQGWAIRQCAGAAARAVPCGRWWGGVVGAVGPGPYSGSHPICSLVGKQPNASFFL